MSNRFANGRKSYGFCDLCSFRYDLKRLKNLVVKTKETQIKACPQCWTPDQPQLQLGMYPISDPQAIRDPRPDTNTWYQSGVNALGNVSEGKLIIQWGWNPVGGSSYFDAPLTPNTLVGVGEVGSVTIGPAAPGGVYVNYSVMPTALLRAATGQAPENTLFGSTLIGGRPLGDIDNTGTVGAGDAISYLRYIVAPSLNPAAYNEYIATVLNPYMIANPVTYAAYLIFT